MLNKHLKAFLESETERLLEPVKEFEGFTFIYEGSRDEDLEEEYRKIFNKARAAAAEWLGQVIMTEIMVTKGTSVATELTCADDDVEVSANVNTTFKRCGRFSACIFDEGDDIDVFEVVKQDRLMTPIGTLTPYVCEVLAEIKGNPLERFYRHISRQADILHDKCGSGVLSSEQLKKHNLNDILDVYRMDLLLKDIDRFFEGR